MGSKSPTVSPRFSGGFSSTSPRSSMSVSPRATSLIKTTPRVKSVAFGSARSPVSSGTSSVPATMDSEPSLTSSADICLEKFGWMQKKGQDRWFLLRDHVLYWFQKEQSLEGDFRKESRGSLPLENCTVSGMQQESFTINAPTGSYLLICKSGRERDEWIKSLEASIKDLDRLVQSEAKRTGWLEKKKKRRWFVLQEDTLSWYAKEGDVKERGQVNLGEYTVKEDDPKTFTLSNLKDDKTHFQIVAKSAEEAKEWVASLKRGCQKGQKKEADILKARATARQNAEARKGGQVTLEKKGWFIKKRKKRYCVLRNTVLMWFVNENDTDMKGSLDMTECSVSTRGMDLNIRTKEGKMFTLTAQRKQDVDDWASAIKDACNAAASNASKQGGAGKLQPKRGWAVKKGKKRYLVLRQGELLYFDREQSGDSFSDKPKGTIKLPTAAVSEVNSTSFLVRSEGLTQGWVFECSSPEESSAWVSSLSAFIAHSTADTGVSMSGFMVKKGKRRWFALKKGTLYWFNDVQSKFEEEAANGKLSLKRCRVVEGSNKTIQITPHVDTGEKPLELTCYTATDVSEWFSALKAGQADAAQSTLVDPFASSGNGLVFGRPIEEVLQRENVAVPNIVTCCCEFLRLTALESPGILRLSGSSNNINKLRDVFDAGGVVDFAREDCELDSIAGLLKLYIRQLPEPPLTFALYQDFLAVSTDPAGLRALVKRLPKPNYDFVNYILDFLVDIASCSDRNQMTPSNIAIVMGPNLLRPKVEDLMSGLKDTPLVLNVSKTLVAHKNEIFQ